jgi:hypothetical protein
VTLCSGLFSQVVTFSSLGFMPVFSTPFFVTLANNRFLYGKKDIGLSLRDEEELGAHSELFCFESKSDNSSVTVTTSRYVWSHPGLRPFGNLLPIQCPDCMGLRTWNVVKKSADNIYLRCNGVKGSGVKCSRRFDFNRAPTLSFVLGRYTDDGRHGQWLKETLVQRQVCYTQIRRCFPFGDYVQILEAPS